MLQSRQAAFAKRVSAYTPIPWEQIPDLGLYMDQVVTYVERQHQTLHDPDERILTPAMVNNYVKMGLVSRPEGKKYGREQLAQLMMICMLKQSASAEGMRTLLTPAEGQDVQALYAHFCTLQTDVFAALASELPLPSPMSCAVKSAAYRFLVNALLAPAPADEPTKEEPAHE